MVIKLKIKIYLRLYGVRHVVKDHSDRVRDETRCRHLGYSFRSAARVLLYSPAYRHDNIYHGLCYTSRGEQQFIINYILCNNSFVLFFFNLIRLNRLNRLNRITDCWFISLRKFNYKIILSFTLYIYGSKVEVHTTFDTIAFYKIHISITAPNVTMVVCGSLFSGMHPKEIYLMD